MTGQSIVCGACSAAVPYGRLSCPNCGELLASVAGARRPAPAAAPTAAATLPDVLYDVSTAPTQDVVSGELAMDGGAARGRDRGAAVAEAAPARSRGRGRGRIGRDARANVPRDTDGLDGLLGGEDAADDADVQATTTGGHAWAIAGASLNGPATPAYMPRPDHARRQAEAAAAATATGAAAATSSPPSGVAASTMAVPAIAAPAFAPAPPATPPVSANAPGAYVPPMPAVAMPAGPAGPARAWVGQVNGHDAAAERRQEGATVGVTTIDATRLAEFVGSVSIAGAALAAVGFLLPWASVMIGSPGSGYFDRWGLAGPAHIVVVIAILAILALSVVKNPIPTWIRTGLGGLGVGALLLGLTWPYLLGPLDAAPGVLIDAIGAVALIGSGILALVTDRHVETDRPV